MWKTHHEAHYSLGLGHSLGAESHFPPVYLAAVFLLLLFFVSVYEVSTTPMRRKTAQNNQLLLFMVRSVKIGDAFIFYVLHLCLIHNNNVHLPASKRQEEACFEVEEEYGSASVKMNEGLTDSRTSNTSIGVSLE